MKIEKSLCGEFIRVTIAGVTHLLPISEWSYAVGHAGEFMIYPSEKLRAQSQVSR